MCGIIGYSGNLEAKQVLINGLEQLEYRGYDSAGIAQMTKETVEITKATGNVGVLKRKLEEKEAVISHCGIGHTRWATHGGVTEENAHPHQFGKVTLIHNGIIENYKKIREDYGKGASFVSQTDTEIAAMLMDSFYDGNPEEAIWKTTAELEGSYAFCVLFEDIPNVVYCIRKVSPLVAAYAKEGAFVASDVTALIAYTQDYFVVPEDTILVLTDEKAELHDRDGEVIEPDMLHVKWDLSSAQKNGYPHYMLKEIYEQPEALHNTIAPRIKGEIPDFEEDQIPDAVFESVQQVKIVACGTAMHAGLIGKVLIEKRVRIPVGVEIASEFRYATPIIDQNTLVIVISQSGETIDTLASLRLAKELGAVTLGIVNVKGSTIARESDYVLYTHAGPEIAVASTKAYTVQIAALCLITMRLALVKKTLGKGEITRDFALLKESIECVKHSLLLEPQIQQMTECLAETRDLFFIGRGIDYALSCEGSIKLKEISYIHSEAYAAGELKHGTISLITEGVPVIAIATQESVFSKMVSNIREVKARGALVILITKESMQVEDSIFDYHFTIPEIADDYTPIPAAVILQLIAYYTSVRRGLNVDQPRNLAKSVTVE